MHATSQATERATDAPSSRPFTIVVGDDFEPISGHAFDEAVRLALRIPKCHLHVVHVARDHAGEAETKRLAGLLGLYISEKCAVDAYAGQSVGIHIRRGDPAQEVAQLAGDVKADLIVVGARHHAHLQDLLHGFLATRLRRVSPCPVLVVEPKRDEGMAAEPIVEPPCPDCLVVRDRSGGSQWWCSRHDVHGYRAQGYSYQSELPFSSHDSSVLPTGTRL